MTFLITTLIEDKSCDPQLIAQSGLSLLVEGDGRKFVYDTGQSPMFLFNARAMGLDPTGADALIFSHGHWDHTGGAAVLISEPAPPKSIYLGRGFFDRKFRKFEGGRIEISSYLSRTAIERSGIPCHEVGNELVQLSENAWLLAGFTPQDEMEIPGSGLVREENGALVTDRFLDEIALILRGREGLTVISGCSHIGSISVCKGVERACGEPVFRFIGGMHLGKASEEKIEHTCKVLRGMGVRSLGSCHCTGPRAEAFFEQNFPGFFRTNVGARTQII